VGEFLLGLFCLDKRILYCDVSEIDSNSDDS
jgi:hypothetical protein